MKSAMTGVVLAGGQGRRQNGQDKGLLLFRGAPLAGHVLDALRPQVGQLVISANRNLEVYARFGVPVITDSRPGFKGPLAGMLSVLQTMTTDWALFAPCDTPAIPHDLAARLRAVGALAAYVQTDDGPSHTCCLLHRSLAPRLEQALDAERRAVRDFLAAVAAVTVTFTDWPASLRNLNTPESLRRAEAA